MKTKPKIKLNLFNLLEPRLQEIFPKIEDRMNMMCHPTWNAIIRAAGEGHPFMVKKMAEGRYNIVVLRLKEV